MEINAYRVVKSIEMDFAHRLMEHPGKCKNIHGHRWKFTYALLDLGVNAVGMTLDFGRLSTVLREVHSIFDHLLVLSNQDPLCDTLAPYTAVLRICGHPTCEVLVQLMAMETTFILWQVPPHRLDFIHVQAGLEEGPASSAMIDLTIPSHEVLNVPALKRDRTVRR